MYPIHLQQLRPQTTAHLAQTMTLLGMTTAELRQNIEAELANNPALELQEVKRCHSCGRSLVESGLCPVCSRPHNPDQIEPIVFTSAQQDYFSSIGGGAQHNIHTDDLPDDNIAPALDLPTYVLQQIAPELAVEDRSIAAHILTSLDDDGLLRIQLFEISRYHHVSIERVIQVLDLIQHSEPIGVGAASPQEALLIQLDILAKIQDIPPLAKRAIETGMDLLSRRHYSKLGELLGIPPQDVEEIAHFISTNLNPYPGRAHWGSIRQGVEANPPTYHNPDILIGTLNQQPDSPLVVEILSPIYGSLQINALFRKALKNAPEEKSEKWQQDFEKANLLIKCLRQRGNTMRQMMTILTQVQRNFILRGDKFLHPLTRASLALQLDVHESTVSRAVSGKTARLPNGRMIPLSKFFDRSLPIRALIREIVKDEDNPLTDSQITRILHQEGHKVARRTVAKYRSMEGILAAPTRQKVANT